MATSRLFSRSAPLPDPRLAPDDPLDALSSKAALAGAGSSKSLHSPFMRSASSFAFVDSLPTARGPADPEKAGSINSHDSLANMAAAMQQQQQQRSGSRMSLSAMQSTGSRASLASVGGTGRRRSFYGAGAMYAASSSSGKLRSGAPTSSPRLSSVPHARESRIEIVTPSPLAPPPGAIVATDKSTIDFSPLAGIGKSFSSAADGGWLAASAHDSRPNPHFDGVHSFPPQQPQDRPQAHHHQQQQSSSSSRGGPFRDPSLDDGSPSSSSSALVSAPNAGRRPTPISTAVRGGSSSHPHSPAQPTAAPLSPAAPSPYSVQAPSARSPLEKLQHRLSSADTPAAVFDASSSSEGGNASSESRGRPRDVKGKQRIDDDNWSSAEDERSPSAAPR